MVMVAVFSPEPTGLIVTTKFAELPGAMVAGGAEVTENMALLVPVKLILPILRTDVPVF